MATEPSGQVHYIVVGFSGGLLGELDKIVPPASVCVIEEPDLIEACDVRAAVADRVCVAEVVEGPAQRQDGAPPPRLAALSTARAVIPASEYGVVAVAVYAQAAGLPGAGVKAALTMRDKIRLRQAAAAAGLAQPSWAPVSSVAGLRAFAAGHGGRCVLKPADRWASIGVQRLGPDDDLDQAWEHRTGTSEPGLLSESWTPHRYLVEEYLDGPEVSAEVLVADGEILFLNVTAKSVWPGRHPVEAGHVVPAPLAPAVRDRIEDANQALVDATGYSTGTLHSEWILADGTRPYLVECAGRLPGDALVPLIDLAYGGSLVRDVVHLLEGGRPRRQDAAAAGAAIRFITIPPGTVRAVNGTSAAAAMEGVVFAGATVQPGELVGPLACSWDRVGHIIATGRNGEEADDRARRAAELIAFEMDPPGEEPQQ